MQEELKALDHHHSRSITRLPEGKRAVGCKWIYKIKFNSDGSIESHKARLMAQGFIQYIRGGLQKQICICCENKLI